MKHKSPKHQIETFSDIGLFGAYVHIKRNVKTGKVRWGVEHGPLTDELRLQQIRTGIRAVVVEYKDRYSDYQFEWDGSWERIPLPLAEAIFTYLCGAIQDAARRVQARCWETAAPHRFRPSGTVIDLVAHS